MILPYFHIENMLTSQQVGNGCSKELSIKTTILLHNLTENNNSFLWMWNRPRSCLRVFFKNLEFQYSFDSVLNSNCWWTRTLHKNCGCTSFWFRNTTTDHSSFFFYSVISISRASSQHQISRFFFLIGVVQCTLCRFLRYVYRPSRFHYYAEPMMPHAFFVKKLNMKSTRIRQGFCWIQRKL